jgi:hypothetical protein
LSTFEAAADACSAARFLALGAAAGGLAFAAAVAPANPLPVFLGARPTAQIVKC